MRPVCDTQITLTLFILMEKYAVMHMRVKEVRRKILWGLFLIRSNKSCSKAWIINNDTTPMYTCENRRRLVIY